MIQNPTPITAATFSGMWTNALTIFLPSTEQPKGLITANLQPFDGTHLLATGGKSLKLTDLSTKRTTDTALDGMLTAIVAEVQRQAKKTAAVRTVTVRAPDPTKPVSTVAIFEDNTIHRIQDCFALEGTDTVFAGVFNSTLGEIARLAGLTVA